MSGDNYLDERMRQVTKWTFWEECIVLGLVYKVGNGSSMVGTSLIIEFYEQIVAYATLLRKEIKVNVKTEKEIISKIKALKSKDSVFQKLLLEQIILNC